MQICKKIFLFTSVFLLYKNSIYAQDSAISMPKMPSISSDISMPSISAPVMGSSFYKPGEIYTGKQKNSSSTSAAKNENAGASTSSSISTSSSLQTENTQAVNKIKSALLGSTSSLLGTSSVTAADLTNFDSLGLLSNISGLNTSTESTATDQMLTSILSELEEIKKNQTSPAKTTVVSNNAQNQDNAKILRFNINGTNVLNTIRTVYFSQKETDGTFLLTADRKYQNQNKTRDETFYILFKADGNCGTQKGYNVSTQVVQDFTNEYSYLYKLSKIDSLHADKTGNLVSVRVNNDDFKMDLLLDIGK